MESTLQLLLPLATALIIIVVLAPEAAGQSNSNTNTNAICTGPMIRSFGSCIGFLATGSNSSSPTSACCNSLRDLMSNGQDCLCLIVTGGVPLQVPINRSLAISLPKACRQSGVPIECKATASPVPAPDPENSSPRGAPTIYPGLSPPPVSRAPFTPQPFTPPSTGGDGGMTRPQTPEGDLVPTLTPPGMRPTLSAAQPSHSAMPSLLIAMIGVFLLKCC
ncbi:Bifunctional inhibitor/lipid-transfer protein/seed storage 2S albumin superfamily protein [Perilla frutescens var. hirtella]|nr:Bifunctional inhibitor/lipid-transfer protein/seed storage 2S albumin superfamily protein [Perilla frutescens var. frutescens]KAH6786928.1 Bifunctional inhibitor/lipid-transfer protein/seed storage 2S albumin superfamily protein [Perilla frutescens var. hirtella]